MAIRACVVLLALLLLGSLVPRDACALDDAMRDRILTSQTRLAAALMTRIPSDPTTGAVMVSPASLAGMLAPLTIAGDDTHRLAMAGVLQFAPGSTRLDDLDAISAATGARRPGEAVETATRYIFAPRSPPTPEAAARLARAGVEAIVAEPTSEAVRAENDAWVSEVTHGKITQVDPPPSHTSFAALNALYFKARWATPFDAFDTSPADFHTADGSRVRALFMHSPPLQSAYREDARFVALDMSIADGRYAMVVLTTKDEPVELASFADHLAWLDGRQFQAGRRIVVDLPRFEASSHQHLLEALLGLGLDPRQTSSGLTTAPVLLAEADQVVKLVINEEGAEVASSTYSGFRVLGGILFRDVSEVIVDKPFAFALRDQQTGLVIAAGFVSRVYGEKLSRSDPFKSAHSHSVMNQNEERAEQHARAAAQASKVPLSPDATAARLRIERDF